MVLRSLPSLLLRPAIAVLDRLRLARKLVVIALVLVAPALYATWEFRSQQNAQIAFSSKERVGVQEIVPGQRLLTELANARALAVRSTGGDAEATAALPAARRTVASRPPRSTAPTAAWPGSSARRRCGSGCGRRYRRRCPRARPTRAPPSPPTTG